MRQHANKVAVHARRGAHIGSHRTHLLSVVSVHLHQLAHIKPGGTQDLDLPHVYALKRVDATALLLNVLTCRS